tara:strand:+ start:1115 stop:1780 length:666 start_codon:yes stop_codon:yes gene_type:complete
MTALQQLLIPKKVKKKIRIFEGNKYGGDGGYVVSVDHLSNYLISLGCCDSTSFEENYLTKLKGEYKIDIYDGEGGCELAQKDPDINFFNKNVYSLNDFHIPDECFIQCDIEGSEISLFSDYNEKTKRIKQMCLEVHFNINKSAKEWINFFEIINSTHSLIHIHGNNNIQGYFEGVPLVTELTYVLSDLLDDLETQDYKCPHKDLDQPNNINLPELEFNWWL